MKVVASLIATLAVGLLASVGAQAATVGSFTFNALGDEFSVDNSLSGPTHQSFPHEYDFTANLTARYHALLTTVSGTFDSLGMQWLGLSGPESGPISVGSGGSATLTPVILGDGDIHQLQINGSGTGTYHIRVTATPLAETPIPGAAILLLSGLGLVGYAGFKRQKGQENGTLAT